MATGRRRHERNVSGILLLDKPVGCSSNEVLQRVKRLFHARKAGHTGSLDVPASGLLPLCFGEATKMSGFLLDAAKRYHAVFRLGVRTSTGDAKGEVVETRPTAGIDAARVRAALARFRGEIDQVPPMHSAIKRAGTPLYKLAYAGETVEREARKVTVFEFELLSLVDDHAEVEVHCSKGTYVRTLAEDVGAALGCGGSVAALRRLEVGPFSLAAAVTLAALERQAAEGGAESLDALLLPADAALARHPDVQLSEDAAYYLRRGQPVLVARAPRSGLVRLYDGERRFLGVGEVLDDGRIAPRRLLQATHH
ncbi:MAG: tRNA pseudouridine(55) synthase TruB [Gammaproteobacteria bacterium]|nr:tRNA pseudouridine(55) synthase TruB [Gammaproteobacteria bacterium]